MVAAHVLYRRHLSLELQSFYLSTTQIMASYPMPKYLNFVRIYTTIFLFISLTFSLLSTWRMQANSFFLFCTIILYTISFALDVQHICSYVQLLKNLSNYYVCFYYTHALL
ncbi:hypothetical protein ACJX0J_017529 [Zea mays]